MPHARFCPCWIVPHFSGFFELGGVASFIIPPPFTIKEHAVLPPRKELFFEIALQLAVHYNLVKNVLVSAEADLVIDHFKGFPGCKKYLAKRPRAFDSPESKLIHEYGIKMNTYSKSRMLSLMQSWVEDDIEFCWFPDLCTDLSSYDTTAEEGDWDLADSLGIALCLIEDRRKKHQSSINNKEEDNSSDDIEWRTGPEGYLIPYRSGSKNQKNCFEDNL